MSLWSLTYSLLIEKGHIDFFLLGLPGWSESYNSQVRVLALLLYILADQKAYVLKYGVNQT